MSLLVEPSCSGKPDHKQVWISVRAPRHARMSIARICTSHIGACRPALGMQACRGTVQRVPEYTPTDARALQLPPASRLSFRGPNRPSLERLALQLDVTHVIRRDTTLEHGAVQLLHAMCVCGVAAPVRCCSVPARIRCARRHLTLVTRRVREKPSFYPLSMGRTAHACRLALGPRPAALALMGADAAGTSCKARSAKRVRPPTHRVTPSSTHVG